MGDKLSVGVLFGGKSAEHEVSIQSARSIVDAIDTDRFEVVLIGIDKTGRWHLDSKGRWLSSEGGKPMETTEVGLFRNGETSSLVAIESSLPAGDLDVVFPVLHGPFGEDGTVQGLLKLANIPFVGAGVLGSAVGMDKDVMKRLLRDAQIPVAPFRVITCDAQYEGMVHEFARDLGLPLFIKPANLGSSVGITKAHSIEEAIQGIRKAFTFDTKVLIDQFVPGREIECSVLGHRDPIASVPGEILPNLEFYSYEAKYIDENGATLIIPAELDDECVQNIRATAVKTFKTLCCSGMARVDMFLTEDRQLVVNEINTIPGFTEISMYPKLWGASGISYTELISRLIDYAIERFEEEKRLKGSYGE
jgi:D-alanine-D-alanine ligase